MKKKGIIIITLLSILIITISGIFYKIKSTVDKWDNLINPSVSVENIDLGGKTKQQALDLVNSKYKDVLASKKITVNVSGKTYTISYASLKARYNIEQTVDKAYKIGKSGSVFSRYKMINNPSINNIKLEFSYDEKPLEAIITKIKNEVNIEPKDAILTKNGENFSIEPEVTGLKLDEAKLKKDILKEISMGILGKNNVQASMIEVSANANMVELETVNTKISTFTTNYGSISAAGRCTNIELATKSINGTVLMPGDTFSFNGIVGERTEAKGYQSAPVLIGNKSDTGLGGGICQVSTTLYNSVLMADIKSTARAHHTLPSHYVSLGFDATVDYGNLDYGFKNTLDFPIYIEGVTSNGNVTFNIYSNSSLTNKTYKLRNDVYQTIEPNVKYIDDATMLQGQTSIEESAKKGYKVKVYLDTYENGKLINSETITNDYYKPVDGIIRRGTKK